MKLNINRYKAFLLDLDGTIYRGKEVIPEAPMFVQGIKESKQSFLFLTNNSSATPEALAQRLTEMGIPSQPGDFFTSAQATAQMIKGLEKEKDPGQIRIYPIGEDGLKEALTEQGFSLVEEAPADYVVVGIDRTFTYEKMKQGVRAIFQGARFISTNRDRAIPTEDGLSPGNGSLTAALAYATGQEPLYVGKPEAPMIRLALAKLQCREEETLLVGDNLETDIAAGEKCGVDTLLVYTGFSQEKDMLNSEIRPTYVTRNLGEL